MELPDDVMSVIREFAKPVCRADWRHGSYIVRNMVSPESNLRADLLMRVHDWREHNLSFEDYVLSFNQLYDTYDVWKDTYHAYFHPDIVSLMEGESFNAS